MNIEQTETSKKDTDSTEETKKLGLTLSEELNKLLQVEAEGPDELEVLLLNRDVGKSQNTSNLKDKVSPTKSVPLEKVDNSKQIEKLLEFIELLQTNPSNSSEVRSVEEERFDKRIFKFIFCIFLGIIDIMILAYSCAIFVSVFYKPYGYSLGYESYLYISTISNFLGSFFHAFAIIWYFNEEHIMPHYKKISISLYLSFFWSIILYTSSIIFIK